jgi:hypothetical protein
MTNNQSRSFVLKARFGLLGGGLLIYLTCFPGPNLLFVGSEAH